MLTMIFENLNSIIGEALQVLINSFLGVLDLDIGKILACFPILASTYSIFQSIGFGLILIIAAMSLLKFFFSWNLNSSFDDSPVAILVNTAIAAALVVFGNYFLELLINAAKQPYLVIKNMDVVQQGVSVPSIDSAISTALAGVSIGTTALSAGAITFISCALNICIAWELIKLMLEVCERYMMVGILLFTSPLAFATYTSNGTRQIFKKWFSMFISSLILMVFSVFFLKLALSGYSFIASDTTDMTTFLMRFLLILAVIQIAQRVDSHLNTLGLSAAQGGADLLGMVIGTGATLRNLGSTNSVLGRAKAYAGSKLGAQYASTYRQKHGKDAKAGFFASTVMPNVAAGINNDNKQNAIKHEKTAQDEKRKAEQVQAKAERQQERAEEQKAKQSEQQTREAQQTQQRRNDNELHNIVQAQTQTNQQIGNRQISAETQNAIANGVALDDKQKNELRQSAAYDNQDVFNKDGSLSKAGKALGDGTTDISASNIDQARAMGKYLNDDVIQEKAQGNAVAQASMAATVGVAAQTWRADAVKRDTDSAAAANALAAVGTHTGINADRTVSAAYNKTLQDNGYNAGSVHNATTTTSQITREDSTGNKSQLRSMVTEMDVADQNGNMHHVSMRNEAAFKYGDLSTTQQQEYKEITDASGMSYWIKDTPTEAVSMDTSFNTSGTYSGYAADQAVNQTFGTEVQKMGYDANEISKAQIQSSDVEMTSADGITSNAVATKGTFEITDENGQTGTMSFMNYAAYNTMPEEEKSNYHQTSDASGNSYWVSNEPAMHQNAETTTPVLTMDQDGLFQSKNNNVAMAYDSATGTQRMVATEPAGQEVIRGYVANNFADIKNEPPNGSYEQVTRYKTISDAVRRDPETAYAAVASLPTGDINLTDNTPQTQAIQTAISSALSHMNIAPQSIQSVTVAKGNDGKTVVTPVLASGPKGDPGTITFTNNNYATPDFGGIFKQTNRKHRPQDSQNGTWPKVKKRPPQAY